MRKLKDPNPKTRHSLNGGRRNCCCASIKIVVGFSQVFHPFVLLYSTRELVGLDGILTLFFS